MNKYFPVGLCLVILIFFFAGFYVGGTIRKQKDSNIVLQCASINLDAKACSDIILGN
ncbi:MAG: hypothetical protein WC783_02935 [Candidatus Paceibacterota bacterium]|jgi:hypothetical protein